MNQTQMFGNDCGALDLKLFQVIGQYCSNKALIFKKTYVRKVIKYENKNFNKRENECRGQLSPQKKKKIQKQWVQWAGE